MKSTAFLLILISFLSTSVSSGQKNNKKIIIAGVVVDSEKNPINDAMILIDNKKTGSVTNEKGYYKVKVSPKAKIISIFTFRNGMKEDAINGRTIINFTFDTVAPPQEKIQAKAEPEERVNVGYGTVSRKEATSSISNIDGQNKKYSSYQNIYNMIKGEVPGVIVIGKTITISGTSTTNSNNQPLIVVDGTIVTTIDDIQPQMVKSIDLLKGAPASIYGSRGANGVLLINLIKGVQK